MNREAQGVLLFVLGGAVLRASLTDMYLRYVKAGLRPILILAGVVLIVAALATLWYEWRRSRANRAAASEDHGHNHREPRIAWLLLLPVFAIIMVAPPALGSYAANRTGTALPRPPGFPELPAGDPLPMTVYDYASRAVYDHGRSLGGRHLTMTGFVTLGRGGATYLTRMVLNCCAADAQPVKVGLVGQVPPGLHADAWIEVVGGYTDKQTRDEVNGGVIPLITVDRATPVKPPEDRYES